MWPFGNKPRQRHPEVRRGASVLTESIWRRLVRIDALRLLPAWLTLAVGAILMDVLPLYPFRYRLGQFVEQDIRARVGFSRPSERLLEEERRRIRAVTPAWFSMNEELVEQIVSELRLLPERVKPLASQPASQAVTQPTQPAIDQALRDRFALQPADAAAWAELASPNRRAKLDRQISSLRSQLAQSWFVLPRELGEQRYARKAQEVIILHDGQKKTEPLDSLAGLDDQDRIAQRAGKLAAMFDPPVRKNIEQYLAWTLLSQPLYRLDEDRTQADIDARLKDLHAHPPMEQRQAGEILVAGTGSREPESAGPPGLKPAELELLRLEHEVFRSEVLNNRPWLVWRQVVGRTLLLLLVAALTGIYVARYQPQVLASPYKGLAVATVLLTMLAMSKAMFWLLGLNPHAAVLPAMLGAVALAIAYNQRFALAMGTALAVFMGLQLHASPDILLVLMVGTAASAYQLREIRSRTKLIKTAGITAAAVVAAVWTGGMAAAAPWRFTLIDSLWAGGFAMLVGFLVQGILPMIERAFRVATSMTLLEWCDASKPLLRRLAMEAPGTYNHSLQLGAMCESAAESIGADGLLARVGAYYHDAGKTNKPDYFVENQSGAASPHAKLSPAMSLLVIIGHVKDGLELARAYGLPPVLHEFIAAHHGTTLVQYFYQAAAEQRKAGAERAPDEVEFRYPGPKPRSREAAILLLADAAESSIRTMAEPTPGRIENQVHAVVSRRLMDGQLDECELTLREVHQIENSLTRSVCAVHHARVAYPTPTGMEPSAAEMRPARRAVEIAATERPAAKPAEQAAKEGADGGEASDKAPGHAPNADS